jgi:hypothetical protein
MELEKNRISSYYTKSSKRSFFFFRMSLGASMFLLLGVLTINLFYINPNQPTSLRSQAADNKNDTSALPSLPAGCEYKSTESGGNFVACKSIPTPTPTSTPANCKYEVSGSEYVIRCDTSGGVPNIQIASPSPASR